MLRRTGGLNSNVPGVPPGTPQAVALYAALKAL